MKRQDPLPPSSLPDAGQVMEYLTRNPGFLEQHPEMIPFLLPPARHYDGSVADIQHFMVKSLQGDIKAYAEKLEQLILFCRDTISVQEQVHEAVLRLLEVDSLQGLSEVIQSDLTMLFDVDDASLCLEADIASEDQGILYLPASMLQQWTLGKPWLGYDPDITASVFPHSSDTIASMVLLPMEITETRQGMLAFGSRDEERFTPDLGTELLGFLSQVLARCVRHYV